ncbi:MAG: hypothetical protein PVF51_05680 [Nitrospirota bacterium]|jgi:hypothetical protein
MSTPEQTLSSSELRNQWGWSDKDFVEALRMGLPGHEPGTKRALSADDIARLGELVTSGGRINVRCKPAEVEQFKRDHPEIFPRGVKPRRPGRRPTEPSRMSVETVAERWTCGFDLIRCLVADGMLSPPEGAGPEGWVDRTAFQEGDDAPTSDFEMFKAERAWGKSAGWKSEVIRKFETDHPGLFESEILASAPQVTRSSSRDTSVGSAGISPSTAPEPQSPAKGGASQAEKRTPAAKGDAADDATDGRREIAREDLEGAIEVAVEMCRWWGKQPENGKRPMPEAIAHVKAALPDLCKEMSETRLRMIASKANPEPVERQPKDAPAARTR